MSKQWGTASTDPNGLIRSDGKQPTPKIGLTLANCASLSDHDKLTSFSYHLSDLPHTPVEIVFRMVMNTIIICARFVVYVIRDKRRNMGSSPPIMVARIQITVANLDAYVSITFVQLC